MYEKLFAGQITKAYEYYSQMHGDHGINLIIQFPIFIQPYTQQLLILYQLEMVPVPVIDKNTKADTYTQ